MPVAYKLYAQVEEVRRTRAQSGRRQCGTDGSDGQPYLARLHLASGGLRLCRFGKGIRFRGKEAGRRYPAVLGSGCRKKVGAYLSDHYGGSAGESA